ncbi:MAG: class I SAM-dependent methyltransferase [Candidatus Nanoarchaeia archaeon]
MNQWEKHFANYDLFMNNFSAYKKTLVYHQKQHKDNKRVLDDGCGTGNLSLRLLRENHEVVAIDFESSAISKVMKKCGKYSSLLVAESMNGSNLSLQDDYVDGVSSMFVIPFVEDNEGYVSEMFRVLRPGGLAVLSAWMPKPDILEHLVQSMEEEFFQTRILPVYKQKWEKFLETSRANAISVKKSYDSINLEEDLHNAGFVNVSREQNNPYGTYAIFITCRKP